MTSCVPHATKFYPVTNETSSIAFVQLKDVFQRGIQSWFQRTATRSPKTSLGILYQRQQHTQFKLWLMTTIEFVWHQFPATDLLCLSMLVWRARDYSAFSLLKGTYMLQSSHLKVIFLIPTQTELVLHFSLLKVVSSLWMTLEPVLYTGHNFYH